MIRRHQLPVHSPIRPVALLRASTRTTRSAARAEHDGVTRALVEMYGARAAALTDSGTSALVLALRLAVGPGKTVAFPGYACIDLAAAARFAGVRVRLYDVDPATLSPDLDSVARVLARGVDAVLVAHLYGFPADVPGVAILAASHGARVIEDAAQGAGGLLHGARLGALGPLSVISFGRGKGTTGGNGGALMAMTGDWEQGVTNAVAGLGGIPAGWRDLVAAAAQWTLGRPGLYGVPSAIPSLRLGEMVYHPAHEPRALSAAAAALAGGALRRSAAEVATRQRNAAVLAEAVTECRAAVQAPRAVGGGECGYLRFPVLASAREAAPTLGIFRGYPRTLAEQEELRPILESGEREQPGALELRRSLLTLPTHSLLTDRDTTTLQGWIRAG
ncbi:MAG: DegT/DnrJ/EryC1/StrS family aminotransferase [Gemmatimonadaceae bacterium]